MNKNEIWQLAEEKPHLIVIQVDENSINDFLEYAVNMNYNVGKPTGNLIQLDEKMKNVLFSFEIEDSEDLVFLPWKTENKQYVNLQQIKNTIKDLSKSQTFKKIVEPFEKTVIKTRDITEEKLGELQGKINLYSKVYNMIEKVPVSEDLFSLLKENSIPENGFGKGGFAAYTLISLKEFEISEDLHNFFAEEDDFEIVQILTVGYEIKNTETNESENI